MFTLKFKVGHFESDGIIWKLWLLLLLLVVVVEVVVVVVVVVVFDFN